MILKRRWFMAMKDQSFYGKNPKRGKRLQKLIRKEVHTGIKEARGKEEVKASSPLSNEEQILERLSILPLERAEKEASQLNSLIKNLTRKEHRRLSKLSHELKPRDIPHFHGTPAQVHPEATRWHFHSRKLSSNLLKLVKKTFTKTLGKT